MNRQRIHLPLATATAAKLKSIGSSGARRRVVLVALEWTRAKDPRIPLGHASLLAALKQAGTTDVESLCFAVNAAATRPELVVRQILACCHGSPVASVDVAIGLYVWNDRLAIQVMRDLRRHGYAGRIIVGGPQVSYAGEGLEALYPDANVFIRGYAEQALSVVVSSSDRIDVAGVHWAGDPDRASVADIDFTLLASPYLSGVLDARARSFVRWETQRGCPYRCAFCQHREPGARLTWRAFDHDRLRREIALLVDAGVEDIAVLDPIFNLGKTDLMVLDEFRRRGFRGRLSLQCRAELVKPAFLDACAELDVRLEFGLQTIHAAESHAVDRPNDLRRVEAVFEELHRRTIAFEVSLIFGLPEQTLASFLSSVEFCLRLGVPTVRAFPLMLLRGTKIERERDLWGLVEDGCVIPSVIASHTFDRADWSRMSAISDALEQSAGRHPQDIQALEATVMNKPDVLGRWSPTTNDISR